ncbi:MAG: hypothetical protein Devi2KO_13690 [Devosia indica]
MEIGGVSPHSCPIQFAGAIDWHMKTNAPKPSASIALALALALALASTGSSQAQACLDKRQIQEAVSSGQIMSLDAVLAQAGVDPSSDILNVDVCDESGRLVYVIGVLSSDGQAQNLTLNAQ